MNPQFTCSQQSQDENLEALQHPAIFRFGQVPPQHEVSVASGFDGLDQALNGGWPSGRLIEILCDRVGIGELSLLLETMPKLLPQSITTGGGKQRTSIAQTSLMQRALWVMPSATRATSFSDAMSAPCIPYAPALAARGIDLAQLVIVQTQRLKDTLWTMEQALLSNAAKRVFGWATESAAVDDFSLRRLSIAARKSESLCFLMRPLSAQHRATPAEVRIAIKPASRNELAITVLKRRGLMQQIVVCVDPRSLTCLTPQRSAISLPSAIASSNNSDGGTGFTRSALVASTNKDANAALLSALQTPIGSAAKVRERSFILDR